VQDLQKAGFRSNKLPNIPEHLLRHWLRGLSDGDGSFYLQHNKTIYSLVFSNEDLANEVLSFVIKNKGMKVYKKIKRNAGILE
jgi:intein-encoded DNA endonuclease-like protein